MNWRNIRLTCAWLLFGLGCIPAVSLIVFMAIIALIAIICIAILFAIAIACVLPGMLLGPNQELNFVYNKEDINVKATWDWGKLGVRKVKHD